MKDMFIYKNGRFVLAEERKPWDNPEYRRTMGPRPEETGERTPSDSEGHPVDTPPAPSSSDTPSSTSLTDKKNILEFLVALFPAYEQSPSDVLAQRNVKTFFENYESWCKENQMEFEFNIEPTRDSFETARARVGSVPDTTVYPSGHTYRKAIETYIDPTTGEERARVKK